ncbi:hypothetical protein NM208_g5301 [Fusarium decemcellulare]|uniref:Uncharacterized protein n=1 Tax=Fusarium decemcellulare TaxID=57161 RepID=A0ACC1SHR4_9HYPO|nr:hypothetical protein NM208_g5301 [Fusarium decemcellulare]
MLITVSIAIQAFLLGLALLVIILRCWARLRFERARLTISEYFAWLGWLFSLGWFICSTIALQILIKHPAIGEKLVVNNVEYLKVFQTLRKALYASTAYLVCCLIASFLLVTLISNPISNNWSIENQLESAWNSYTNFVVQWCLNFSTDLLLFCFPFFLLPHLKLRKEQKIGLVGVFSLGAITLTVSLARFIAYNVTDFGLDDASGNTLCTAEMTTAVIVVCLPGLKKFVTRSKSPNTSDPVDASGQSGSGQSRSTRQAYAEWGVRDDEIELVTDPRKSYPPSTADGRDAIKESGDSGDGQNHLEVASNAASRRTEVQEGFVGRFVESAWSNGARDFAQVVEFGIRGAPVIEQERKRRGP